ncbi:MAG: hypothetical protein LWW85_14205 [Marinilabiliales bacterium]|nr:hypothetical protein [Marinilabiliales bacterium]
MTQFRTKHLPSQMLGFLLLVLLIGTTSLLPRPIKRVVAGSSIVPWDQGKTYEDSRPQVHFRLNAMDAGVVLKHGMGPDSCDGWGARDCWVWEFQGRYYMHYDGAGSKGWLTCLATSTNLTDWQARGSVLDFGTSDAMDCASASYGTTYFDGSLWHMFYLGTPHVTKKPDYIPAFPYLTMKAEANSPTGPWHKRYDVTPFSPKPDTYYSATASPGHICLLGSEWIMYFSASTGSPGIKRTISLARTTSLSSTWEIEAAPMLPPDEQIENSSVYFQKADSTWFLFTNHVGIDNRLEYTDAIWVYWSKDPFKWDPKNKAVVLDSYNCTWSKKIIGLPSVVPCGNRLALFYDGNDMTEMPRGVKSHMNRDIGLAYLALPIRLPGVKK